MQTTTVSVLPSCMHAAKNIPPLRPFENVPSSTICGGGACNCVTSRRCQECFHKSVSFVIFSIIDLPHKSACVPCETNSNKFLSRLHPSFIFWWQKGSSWTSGLCLLLLKGIQSVHFLQCCCLPVFCLLFTSHNLLHVALSWCALLFCWWWSCWTQVFWTSLGIIHKLLDGKIATFTILHKEGVKQASHMLTGKSYSCLVALTGWGYVSVCEIDVIANISVDALLVNELVSHFWDIETVQWHCRCLRGIVDVVCVISLCAFCFDVVCCGWCFFQMKDSFFVLFVFLNEQTLWQVAR